MEKEKYEPTLEEVEKAEEMTNEEAKSRLTEEQKKMSSEREATLGVGVRIGNEQGRKEILRMESNKFEEEKANLKATEENEFSEKTKKLVLDGAFGIQGSFICPKPYLDKDSFLEFFEKTNVKEIDICGAPHLIQEDVFRKLYKRSDLVIRGKKEIRDKLKEIFKDDEKILSSIKYRFEICR